MKSENLGKELRRIRKENKKSLQDVANKLSVSPQAVSQYELSKRDIPNLMLIHMFQSLGVQPGDLVKVISGIEDIPDDEKRNFFDFLHEADLGSYAVKDLSNDTESVKVEQIQVQSKIMVRKEKYIGRLSGKTIFYEVILHKEEIPAILNNEEGTFQIDLRISIQSADTKEFTLNCRYQPASDIRVHLIVVFIDKIFSNDADLINEGSHYDLYAKRIEPEFLDHLVIAIENSIKVYFMDLLRRPMSIDIYHNM
jgi:transcriptional regulator with XRE-family HTH domain